MLVTEEGLRAAEASWDAHYHATADRCEAKHAPQTPEMEQCFGATYDANYAVDIAVQAAVYGLREYWQARALGAEPDRPLGEVLREIARMFERLPPEAREYFTRVTGI